MRQKQLGTQVVVAFWVVTSSVRQVVPPEQGCKVHMNNLLGWLRLGWLKIAQLTLTQLILH